MKTFDEKDLITWANRDKAIIGKEYYFGDCLDDIKRKIKYSCKEKLIVIEEDYINATFKGNFYYSCILPVEAVKEEEKKYRPCKTIQEFCELVTGNRSLQADEQCSLYLIGCKIHYRNKYKNEFYTIVTQIRIIDDEYLIDINSTTFDFNELFDNFEIEINGEWQPFGIIDSI